MPRTRRKSSPRTSIRRRAKPARSRSHPSPRSAATRESKALSPSPRFQIVDDRLQGPSVLYRETPNKSGSITPQYLVFHYTAGQSAEASVEWLTNPLAKASAHLVVGRDGSVTQLAPFTTKTWHAGVSHWDGLTGMNQYSIGIEMDNAGPLTSVGSNLKAWFGKTYPKSQAIQATHKLEAEPRWWHAYSEQQIAVASELAILLVNHYGLKDIIGHEDIAPERKRDPGPAFPLQNIKSRVMGRAEDEGEAYLVTASRLNIRSGPGSEYDPVGPPLAQGTKVFALEKRDRWTKVEVATRDPASEKDLQGWVFNQYLEAVV